MSPLLQDSGQAPLPPLPELLQVLQATARQAGELILQVYGTDFEVASKSDASPVTLADERAEACIVAALRTLQPAIPIVAEEAAARGDVPVVARRFWLVDPLDGTREFVARNGEFTVNIALIEDGVPVLGMVFAPVLDALYLGCTSPGSGAVDEPGAPPPGGADTPAAWLVDQGRSRRISCRMLQPQATVLACSRSHGDDVALEGWLSRAQPALKLAARRAVGSSLKFGLLAAAQADVYPRFGPTMEWDTAAGHAVLLAAGGAVLDLQGRPLSYGKAGFRNPHFVAWGRR